MWALVVVPLPNKARVMGAPVTAKVARSVVRPAPKEAKAWVGALMRKSLWSVMLPFAWVLVRARLNCTSGASVEAVSTSISRAGQGEIRGGATRAGGLVECNGASGSESGECESPLKRLLPCTESRAVGEVVPMPTEPLVVKFPLLVVVALPPIVNGRDVLVRACGVGCRGVQSERFVMVLEALLTRMPPVNVARPVTESVPVAVMLAAERLPEKRPLPWTESACEGEVVPMPTELPRNCAA